MPAHPRHKAWLDGRVVDPEHVTVGIFTQTALRGANVYEGIRAYWSEERQNLYVWKLDPHLRHSRPSPRTRARGKRARTGDDVPTYLDFRAGVTAFANKQPAPPFRGR